MKNFDKCQRIYDNMTPDGNVRSGRSGKDPEDMAEEAEASRRFDERMAEKQSKKLGRYVYTEEEAKALNRLGW